MGGLIVGEGCFALGVSDNHGKTRIKPIFQIKMADLATMQKLIDYFKSNDLPLHVREDGPFIRVRCDGLRRCGRVIRHFLDDLSGTKLQAAQTVLRFIESREPKSNWDSYSESEKEMVRELRNINGVRNGKKNPI